MERQTPSLSPELRGIALSLAAAGTALLASVAFAACAARLGGVLDQPLPSGVALAAMLLTAAWCASIRAAWLAAMPQVLPLRFHLLIALVPLVAAILLVRGFTFSPLSDFATFLLWFAVLAEEAITLGLYVSTLWADELRAFVPQQQAEAPLAEASVPAAANGLSIMPAPVPEEAGECVASDALPAEEEEICELPPGVTQQLTRGVDGDQEQVHGLVRASFVAGQRHAHVHLGFCPPLSCVPQVELHQLEGPEVQVKTGQVLSSGVRFDLKLREAATSDHSAVFEFLASSPSAHTGQLRSVG